MKPLLDHLLAGTYLQDKGGFQFHAVVTELMSWIDGKAFNNASPRLGRFATKGLEALKSILDAQMFMSKPVQNLSIETAKAVSWISRKDDTGDRLLDDGETWAEVRRWLHVSFMSDETKDFA